MPDYHDEESTMLLDAMKHLGLREADDATPNIYEATSIETSEDAARRFDKEAQSKTTQKLFREPPVEQGKAPQTSWKNLISIDILQISKNVNMVRGDRIMWLTTIRSPYRRADALYTLVQDTTGQAMTLSLWNYLELSHESSLSLELVLPKGSYLAILAPLMVEQEGVGGFMIRCDNPQCVKHFDNQAMWNEAQGHPPSTTESSALSATIIKDQGNQFFGKKAYRAACKLYSQALAVAGNNEPEVTVSCLGNMAEACLQMNKYEDAECFARKILMDHDPTHAKARFRLARALLYQNQPAEAKELVMQLRKEDPNNQSFQSLLKDCVQAVIERQMGAYQIRKLLDEAEISPELPFHADFVSPKIDPGVAVVRPSDGETYRGVIAKEDLKEGELLTASRAFAFCFSKRRRNNRGDDDDEARKRHLYVVRQVHQAITTLVQNPRLSKRFFSLEASGVIHDDDPDKMTIDLARIRSILVSNRFGVDWTSPASPFRLRPPEDEPVDEEVMGVGLWLTESLFNHSCTPNCTWAPIGNHMFIYATKPISKGDELCISYVHDALSYQDRKERFECWNGGKGFICGCEWCHMMRSNDTSRAMNQEVSLAQKLFYSGKASNGIDSLLSRSRRQEILQTHEKLPGRFQHTVYTIHMLEALQCAQNLDRRGALEAVKAASSLGYAIRGGLRQETRVQDLACLVAASMVCNEDNTAREALVELCKHQLVLPSFNDFQKFVMMSSITFWEAFQSEPFMNRWATINKEVWAARSAQIK